MKTIFVVTDNRGQEWIGYPIRAFPTRLAAEKFIRDRNDKDDDLEIHEVEFEPEK